MALTALLRKRGGCAVLDGGMGTGLGRLGLSPSECWTAGRSCEDERIRDAVLAVHVGFLRAGADVLTANTYNVSQAAEIQYGATPDAAAVLEDKYIRANIELAKSAINVFAAESAPFDGVLAASMGCFGTSILGRGETANRIAATDEELVRVPGYGVEQAELEAFHRSRATTALDAGVDVLAFETVPDLLEARAIATVLSELEAANGRLQAMVMFTCRDAEVVDNGDRFEECCEALADCGPVAALGVNCTEPRLVDALLAQAKRAAPSKLLIAKPNSGEAYDMTEGEATLGGESAWRPLAEGELATPGEFGKMAKHWRDGCGASLVGGCCRIGHEDIAAVRAELPRP